MKLIPRALITLTLVSFGSFILLGFSSSTSKPDETNPNEYLPLELLKQHAQVVSPGPGTLELRSDRYQLKVEASALEPFLVLETYEAFSGKLSLRVEIFGTRKMKIFLGEDLKLSGTYEDILTVHELTELASLLMRSGAVEPYLHRSVPSRSTQDNGTGNLRVNVSSLSLTTLQETEVFSPFNTTQPLMLSTGCKAGDRPDSDPFCGYHKLVKMLFLHALMVAEEKNAEI